MRSFGAFGKIPVLGDFFRTGLGNEFVSGWDEWLQLRLTEAREELGESWETCYMSAPIWRFSVAAGLVGEEAMIGVLMPSVDRVGRKFPLTLTTDQPGSGNSLVGHFARGSVFEQLESLALDALDDAMTLDDLKTGLASIRRQETPVEVMRQGGVVRVRGEGALDPALAAAMAAPVPSGASIWTSHVDSEARLVICDGLPSSTQMIEMFDEDAAVWQGVAV